jgi:uroporphyrinogen decarboxylase
VSPSRAFAGLSAVGGKEIPLHLDTMGMHTDFQRFRKALLCQKPDRVPLAEMIVDVSIMGLFLGKPVDCVQDEIEFYRVAGYDYFPVVAMPDFNPERRTWNEELKGVITTDAEFEEYPWPGESATDYSRLEEATRLIPDDMELVVITGGFFYHVWRLMGYTEFCYATADNPDLVARMFQKVGALVFDAARNMMNSARAGALWISSDIAYTSGLMASPALLRQHFFPWFRKLGALCRARDIPFIYHSDGKLWDVMPEILESGVNALHPLEPKSMDALELKKSVGARLCLVGHIDLDRLARGTPAEIERMVRDNIETLGQGGGYCVGSSNTIADFVNIENYRAMIDAALKYGSY